MSQDVEFQVELEPRQPPVFSGKGQDVETWLHLVDDYFALVKPSEDEKVAFIIHLLRGSARDWWIAEKVHQERQPSTVIEIKELLLKAFSSPLRARKARIELRGIRQRKGEDYREYATRFKSLLSKLPPASYSEAVIVDDWIFGLTPPWGERVMAQGPKTLQEAIEIMGNLDFAHRFCRREGSDSSQTGGVENEQMISTNKRGVNKLRSSTSTRL